MKIVILLLVFLYNSIVLADPMPEQIPRVHIFHINLKKAVEI